MESQKAFGEIPPSIREALTTHVPLAPGQIYPTPPDENAVRQMVDRCRKISPDVTEDEIIHFIHLKAKKGALVLVP